MGGGNSGLSVKEMELLAWMKTDLSLKEIAAEMIISPRTVEGYRDSLFKKFGVRNRVALVLEAIRQGLIDID